MPAPDNSQTATIDNLIASGAQMTSESIQVYRSDFADDEDMKELVGEYVDRLPAEVARLSALLESKQIEDLRRVAHQLKGSGGGYGFPTLTELAAVADRSIKDNAPLERIKADVDALIAFIRRIQGYDVTREISDVAESSRN
jgi:histidine phosphotransfer protein HptB